MYGVDSFAKTEIFKKQHAKFNLDRFLKKIKNDPEVEFINFSEFDAIWSTS